MEAICCFRLSRLFLLLLCSGLALRVGAVTEDSVPFTLDSDGHILFKAMIDGVEGNFIFDTGAGINVLSKSFFDKLPHMVAADGVFTGFRATGDRIDSRLYYAKELSIGKNTFGLSALTYFDMGPVPFDGIISIKNFEKDVIFTIDYSAKTLTFAPRKNLSALEKGAKGVIPLQLQDERGICLDIFCRVRICDTLTLQFCLDSGAGTNGLRINQVFMKYLPIDTADTAHVRTITHASEFKPGYVNRMYVANIDRLALADAPAISVHSPRAQFVEDLIYDGIMSINWLGNKLTFSIPDKEIVIQQ
jgi:Aspartyl protease